MSDGGNSRPTMDLAGLRRQIAGWAAELGFDQVGVADVDLSAHEAPLRDWLARGLHGGMDYMARHVEARLQPARLEPDTCRVISARMNYLPEARSATEVLASPALGYVSRYALGRDYHKVLRRRLATLARRIDGLARSLPEGGAHRYRAFTDSAPVLEKPLAEKAGLGWRGKHTLLLHPDVGSWFFLGEIYTSLPLPPDAETVDDRCGACQACLRVCPTGAIIGERQLDARRCVSYLTIEHRGSIPEPLRPLIGNRIFGCDDCQLFCPWNRYARPSAEADFAPRHRLDGATLLSLFAWTPAEFDERTRGSALRRISYDMWLRNLAVALGNGPGTPEAVEALTQRHAGSSPLVREHIDWALRRLAPGAGSAPGNS